MSSIDERVVQMQFDNKQFERGVRETMSSLNKFKKSLDFEGAERGLNSVASSVKKVSFDPMARGIQEVHNRFTALDIFVGTAIKRWSEKIQQFGEKMVRSMTLDNVKAGWGKYEAVMNATRTIMNATGKAEADVDAVMNKLMKYSDETSYSFSQMSGYISQFASSGAIKDLESAEQVMEGIANAAAHAGIGVTQAAAPMQTIVKAMSRGKMQLEQWQSLQLQNFLTPALIKELINAGKALGTLDEAGNVLTGTGKKAKKIAVTQTSIADTLRYDWMTSAVMEKAFKNYVKGVTDLGTAAFKSAQEAKTFTDVMDTMKDAISTGWMNSFKLLIGGVDDASKFFTNMADRFLGLISPISELRNEVLQGWVDLGGRNDLYQSFDNIMDTVERISKVVSDTLADVFGVMDSAGFKSFTESVQNATRAVVEWLYGNAAPEGDKIAPRFVLIKNAAKGLASGIQLVAEVWRGVFGFVKDLFADLFPASDSLLMTLGKLGYAFSEWVKKVREGKVITTFFHNVYTFIRPIVQAIPGLVSGITSFIERLFGLATGTKDATERGKALSDWWKDFSAKIGQRLGGVAAAFGKLTNLFEYLAQSTDAEDLQKRLGTVFEKIKQRLAEKFEAIKSELKKKWKTVNEWIGDAFENAGKWIRDNWPSIQKGFQDAVNKVVEWLPKAWATVRDTVVEWFRRARGTAETQTAQLGQSITAGKNGIVSLFTKKIPELWGKVKPVIDGLIAKIIPWVQARWDSFVNLFSFADVKFDPEVFTNRLLNLIPLFAAMLLVYLALKAASRIDAGAMAGLVTAMIAMGALIDSLSNFFATLHVNFEAVPTFLSGLRDFFTDIGKFLTENRWVIVLFAAMVAMTALGHGIRKFGVGMKELAKTWSGTFISIKDSGNTFAAKKEWLLAKFAGWTILMAGIYGFIKLMIPLFQEADGWKHVLSAAGLLAVFMILMTILNKIGESKKDDGSDRAFGAIMQIGVGALALALGVGMIFRLINASKGIAWGEAIKELLPIGGIMLALASILAIASGVAARIGGGKAGPGIQSYIGLVGGLVVMVQVFKGLFNDFKTLTGDEKKTAFQVAGIIALVGLAFGAVLALGRSTDEKTAAGKTTTKFKGALSVMAAFIVILEEFKSVVRLAKETDPWTMVAVGVGFLAVLGLMALIIRSAKNSKNAKTAFMPILSIAAIFYVIGDALKRVKDISWPQLTAFMGGLVLTLAAMALVLGVSKKMDVGGVFGILLMFITINSLVYLVAEKVMPKLGSISWEQMAAFFGGIAAVMIGASAAAAIASAVGIKGFLFLAAGISVLGLVAAALVVVASIVAGIAGGAISNFGEKMWELGTYMGQFMKSTENLSQDRMLEVAACVGDLIGLFGDMLEVDYSGLKSFNSGVFSLGNRLFFLNAKLAGIDPTALKEKLGVAQTIKDLASDLASVPNVPDLATTIANIGAAIKLYYDNVAGIEIPEGAEGGTDVSQKLDMAGVKQMIHDLAIGMPSNEDLLAVGAYAENTEGGTNLTNFALGVTNLGTALQGYTSAVKDIKMEDLTEATTLLNELKGIPSQMPTEAEISTIFGSVTYKKETLSSFSEGVEDLAGAFISMGTAIKGVDENGEAYDRTESLNNAVSAATKLSEINAALPEKGFWGWLTGQNALGEFAGNLLLLGSGLAQFLDQITGKDFSNTESALGFLNQIKDMQIDLGENSEGFWANLFNATAIGNLNSNLKSLGDAVHQFYVGLFPEGPDQTQKDYASFGAQIDEVMRVISGLGAIKLTVGEGQWAYVWDLTNQMPTMAEKIVSFYTTLDQKLPHPDDTEAYLGAQTLVDFLTGITTAFANWGLDLDTAIQNGITDNAEGTAVAATETMAKSMLDALSKHTDRNGSFYNIGWNIVTGLGNGIAANTTANASMRSVVENLIRVAEDTAKVRSPSRVFMEIGGYLSEGLAIGVDKGGTNAITAMHDVSVAMEKDFRDYWGIHSPGVKMKKLSEQNMQGAAIAIADSKDMLSGTMKTAFGDLADAATKGLNTVGQKIRSVTTVADKYLGTNLTETVDNASASLNSMTNGAKEAFSTLNGFIDGTSSQDLLDFSNFWGLSQIGGDSDKKVEIKSSKGVTVANGTPNYSAQAAKYAAAAAANAKANGTSIQGATSASAELGRITTSVSSGGLLLSSTDGYTVGDILSRMDRLENAILNMQLVLDTGVLAGGVASGVDRELGMRTNLEGRWN